MRTKDHCLAESGRFNGVLSALRSKTLAHKDNIGPGVEVTEFTGGVDQQALQITRFVACVRPHVLAEDVSNAQSLQFCSDGSTSFMMPRHEHQEEPREPGLQAEVHGSQDAFFTVMGAAGHQNYAVGNDPQLPQ